MRIAVPDLVSNSYFPAVATIELGFFKAQGMDVELEMIFPVGGAMEALRDGATLAPVPGGVDAGVSFGVHAARALEEGIIDGFWANAMGAEVAVRNGIGSVALDLRRGLGPPAARDFTFAALVTTDRLVKDAPDAAERAVSAIVEEHRALRADPSLAAGVGERLFPPYEAALIEDQVRRDAPYYVAEISPNSVANLNEFSRNVGLLSGDIAHEQVVATRFAHLWSE